SKTEMGVTLDKKPFAKLSKTANGDPQFPDNCDPGSTAALLRKAILDISAGALCNKYSTRGPANVSFVIFAAAVVEPRASIKQRRIPTNSRALCELSWARTAWPIFAAIVMVDILPDKFLG